MNNLTIFLTILTPLLILLSLMLYLKLKKINKTQNEKDSEIKNLKSRMEDVHKQVEDEKRTLRENLLLEEENRKKDADFAAQYKSAFLANMSHEMRTPLNVIIGLTDLILEEKSLTKFVSSNLQKVSNAGGVLLSTINDILDFSKIESGKLTLMSAEYHVSSLLNDIITLMNTRIGDKSVSFLVNLNEDIPSMLYGDELRVKQIFNNLLSNAIKYTNIGKIELSVKCEKSQENKNDVFMDIVVSDTGIGISEDEFSKIFTEFYQVESNANRKIEGSGLGLTITHRLIKMMDGEIKVTSTAGLGSIFQVRIKQGFVDEIPIGRAIAENLSNFNFSTERSELLKKLIRPDLSNARVLVVDDMQTNLDVAIGLLSKYKMKVDSTLNGQDALSRIIQEKPRYSAIFIDHMMPGMDGIETADAIRALGNEYAKKIPLIALTANAVKGTEDLFYAHDFQAFLSKPIDIMKLDSVVRKWIKNEIPRDNKPGEITEGRQENAAISISGLDTEKGLGLYDHDMQNYTLVLRSFIANLPLALDRIRSVGEDNLLDYAINLHGIKSMATNIGAVKTSETALKLEKMGREGDLEGILSINEEFINDTEILLKGIKNWLEKNSMEINSMVIT